MTFLFRGLAHCRGASETQYRGEHDRPTSEDLFTFFLRRVSCNVNAKKIRILVCKDRFIQFYSCIP
jgi:hypothetical protein